MLLADVNRRAARSAGSAMAAFTSRWQSSNAPRTAKARTFPPHAVNCFSCRGDTIPAGYSTATSTPGRPWNAAATAPPVSPDVATRMVSGRASPPRRRNMSAARKRAPTSLNAAVGPWKSSSTVVWPGRSRSGTAKVNASRQMSPSAGASSSPAKNGSSSRPATSASVSAPSSISGAMVGYASGT